MSDSENPTRENAGLPDLVGLAVKRWRLIAGCATGFLALAVIGTILRKPVFEATAFIEVTEESEIATIRDRLKFPSLYREVSETDDAAVHLEKRTRVRSGRGSRIVGIAVQHPEPTIAVEEANAIVGRFVEIQNAPASANDAEEDQAKLRNLLRTIDELPHPEAADSPEQLAEAWRNQKSELEKLEDRYADDHPVLTGARERFQKLEEQMREQFGKMRQQLDLPESAIDPDDFPKQIVAMVDMIGDLRKRRDRLTAEIEQMEIQIDRMAKARKKIALAEPAALPLEPAGPRSLFIWLGALALGAFAGFLFAFCRPA